MPRERLIHFSIGYLKLNFIGKLRLTQNRNENEHSNKIFQSQDGPSKTYGVIEDKDFFIKFDKPVLIKYFNIRPRILNTEYKFRLREMIVNGYRNNQIVFRSNYRMIENNREWTKFVPSQAQIDTIQFPVDFEVDNIHIIHDSDYLEEGLEQSSFHIDIDDIRYKNGIKEEDI